MSKKKTHEEYVEEVKNKNPLIEVVGEYVGIKIPILHRCTVHDVLWKSSPDNILQGKGCELCRIDKIRNSKRKTMDWYIDQLSTKNPDVELVGNYVDMHTPILHHCLLDDVYWDIAPTNALKGSHCPECWKRQIGDKNRKTPEQYVQDVKNMHMYIEPMEDYVGAYIPILHKCSVCGAIWKPIPHNILGGRGCPGCVQSYKEQQISKWLFEHNIIYSPQYTFSDCVYKKMLPFDFYLPDYNMCIEYDGEQHYKPIDFSGNGYEYAVEQLQIIKLRDSIKTEYCMSNNIVLLRIPYWEDIEDVLSKNFLI